MRPWFPSKLVVEIVVGWLNAFGLALTSTVRPEVVSRVITIARECGFTELEPRYLQEVSHQAHTRWLELSLYGGSSNV